MSRFRKNCKNCKYCLTFNIAVVVGVTTDFDCLNLLSKYAQTSQEGYDVVVAGATEFTSELESLLFLEIICFASSVVYNSAFLEFSSSLKSKHFHPKPKNVALATILFFSSGASRRIL